jgi:hypothetical protein
MKEFLMNKACFKKKWSKIVFTIAILNIASSRSFAQIDSSLTDTKNTSQRMEKEFLKNNFKINLSSLALNNYSFGYERNLTRRLSFQAGYRIMPNTILGQTKLAKKIIDLVGGDNGEAEEDLNKISATNSSVTGEFRFYSGKKQGARGFYLSLYGRYMNLKFDYPYDYEASNKLYIIPLQGNLQGFGGGLMIGSKWLIAKRVVLDLYILGGHYGKLTGNINGITDLSTMSVEDKQQLKYEIENLFGDDGKKYLKTTVTNQGVYTIVDGPFLGFRGLGLSVGIAF